MERYQLTKDVKMFCIQAHPFPAGVEKAFDQLINLFTGNNDRDLFGISYKNKQGIIIYKAAIAAGRHEDCIAGCEIFILPRGAYLTQSLDNWRDNTPSINRAFSGLLSDKRLDKNFPCIEWYENDLKMMCMVKIDEGETNNFSIDQDTGLIRH